MAPLHYYAAYCKAGEGILQALLAAGADINAKNCVSGSMHLLDAHDQTCA